MSATYRVSVTRGGVTRTTDLDEPSAQHTVWSAVHTALTVVCRKLRDDEPRLPGIVTAPAAGSRLRSKIDDEDTDERGRRRLIPIGSEGTVQPHDGGELYDIAWDNGGWTRWTLDELARDAEVL